MVHKDWIALEHATRKAVHGQHGASAHGSGSPSATSAGLAAGALVDAWAARHATRNRHAGDAGLRRELCETGFVFGTWSGHVGTGNNLVRTLTGALVALVLDKPYVLNEAVSFLDNSATDRAGPWRRPFEANLSAAASGNGGMAWLRAPHIIEDDALRGWPEASSAQTPAVRDSIIRWCHAAGAANVSASDFAALDLRAPAASKGDAFDVRQMVAKRTLCANASKARIVIVHAAPVANFEVLRLNTALSPGALSRLRTLTTRGVNSYGLLQRALWPQGLTRLSPLSERPTLAVHLRCWMLACSPRVLAKAAECASGLLHDSGPECVVYVASDHSGMAALLAQALFALDASLAGRCVVIDYSHLRPRLPHELRLDVEHFQAAQKAGSIKSWVHAATMHDPGSAASHPPPWADPIDLAMLSSSQTVLGMHVGALSSTLAFMAGTRIGRYFYLDDMRNWTCGPAARVYPTDQNRHGRDYVRKVAAIAPNCSAPAAALSAPTATSASPAAPNATSASPAALAAASSTAEAGRRLEASPVGAILPEAEAAVRVFVYPPLPQLPIPCTNFRHDKDLFEPKLKTFLETSSLRTRDPDDATILYLPHCLTDFYFRVRNTPNGTNLLRAIDAAVLAQIAAFGQAHKPHILHALRCWGRGRAGRVDEGSHIARAYPSLWATGFSQGRRLARFCTEAMHTVHSERSVHMPYCPARPAAGPAAGPATPSPPSSVQRGGSGGGEPVGPRDGGARRPVRVVFIGSHTFPRKHVLRALHRQNFSRHLLIINPFRRCVHRSLTPARPSPAALSEPCGPVMP